MQFSLVLPLVLTWTAALDPSSTDSSAQPTGSGVFRMNADQPGGARSQLQKGGRHHWRPSQAGHGPSWGHHPHGPKNCVQIQKQFPFDTNAAGSESASRADAVKQAYLRSWNQYADNAFGYDGFNPLANQGSNGSGGWGLIIIDGIDTAAIMGLTDVVDRQLAHIASQDFNVSTGPQIDGFDITIRLIGGLLSAYDLITSHAVPDAQHYLQNKTQVNALLNGARTLADFIAPKFDTDTGLPYFWINTTTRVGFPGPGNTAVDGTIILEYHRLSDLTGDDSYRQMADKAESYLLNSQPAPVFPGLVGSNVDMNTGLFTNENAGWQSGIDSFFEYLIKSYIYDPSQEYAEEYKDFWTTAVESTYDHLAFHPYGFPNLTFITVLNDTGYPLYELDDYSCFAGGNWLLSGAYLNRQDFVDFGLSWTDNCHYFFNTTVSGLNAPQIAWYGPDNTSPDPAYNGDNTTALVAREMFDKYGYFIRNDVFFGAFYSEYPEPIESMFYAYRITGDTRWQEYNWEVFQSLIADGYRPPVAMSDLANVSEPLGGGQFGDIPSYYFAETLKYFYLTFSEPKLVSLDDFVFNTEGHPLRIQKGTCSTL